MGIVIRRNKSIQENRRVRQNVRNVDLVHGTIPEQDAQNAGTYEFGGYHRTSIEQYLQGKGGGSPYSRQIDIATGKVRSCGLNFYERLYQRNELLLRATGEPVVLLRRKWTGEMCPCFDRRRGRADARCPACFGGGFVGGFVRFVNLKEPDGRIFIKINPTEEDLNLEEQGLFQSHVPSCWTLPSPTVRDRDILVRYDPHTGKESWRYEIQNVTRNMGLFNTFTNQTFSMFRLDKTSPIYIAGEVDHFLVDLANDGVGDLRGKGDEYQDVIEEEFGDGYRDGGFSLGYHSGYDKGYHDAFFGKDLLNIPDDDMDGFGDIPFGQNDGYGDRGAHLIYWQAGFNEGYIDGVEDGMRACPAPERFDFETRGVDVPTETSAHTSGFNDPNFTNTDHEGINTDPVPDVNIHGPTEFPDPDASNPTNPQDEQSGTTQYPVKRDFLRRTFGTENRP